MTEALSEHGVVSVQCPIGGGDAFSVVDSILERRRHLL